MVTPVPGTNQCAEMARIAFGLDTCAPMRRQASVYELLITAFIGLPWPKKIAGNVLVIYKRIRGFQLLGDASAAGARTMHAPIFAYPPRSGSAQVLPYRYNTPVLPAGNRPCPPISSTSASC
ncbi:MAG: hypothetical protein ABI082_04150 [Dokdonella sp.]